MKIAVLYVGSSLPGSLRRAERDINERHHLGLSITAHNFTLPIADTDWPRVELDLSQADLVFVIHVTDGDNVARIAQALDRFRPRHRAVIAINCMGELMRRTRLGTLDFFAITSGEGREYRLVRKLGTWMGSYAKARRKKGESGGGERYIKYVRKLPGILRFLPSIGPLGDVKHYLALYSYFSQPTPANIRSMILRAVEHCLPEHKLRVRIDPPESVPVTGIYHPDAPSLFETFEQYRAWYEGRANGGRLSPDQTIGLLLLRPQVVSGARRHYDALIRTLEREGLPVIPALSTFMDNREACRLFLTDPADGSPRISQLVSLTGFSFVGGPAMNDSEAAVAFHRTFNRPYRSLVSLEMQPVEHWADSLIGLNPVQTAMQVALPEIDGASEPHVYGGVSSGKDEPQPMEDRCLRIARRLARWNRLRRLPPGEVRLAFIVYCFPPNKGNLGTAADLDVFPSLWHTLRRLEAEGYGVQAPESADALRELLLEGDSHAAVAYRLPATEYYRLCPYVDEIEAEWGPAPGRINAQGRDILIHGIRLGNVFVGVQPSFGYEGDPMRLLMARGGTPHHGFMGLYTYLQEIFQADAVVHVGTHGALEFMPGKQVGLSSQCWPDRLIGEFPNVYIYSVNNPSEGTIARRRSYAGLISYLTPPIESAGLYKELAALKELISAYRLAPAEREREQLFAAIEEKAGGLNLDAGRLAGRDAAASYLISHKTVIVSRVL